MDKIIIENIRGITGVGYAEPISKAWLIDLASRLKNDLKENYMVLADTKVI